MPCQHTNCTSWAALEPNPDIAGIGVCSPCGKHIRHHAYFLSSQVVSEELDHYTKGS